MTQGERRLWCAIYAAYATAAGCAAGWDAAGKPEVARRMREKAIEAATMEIVALRALAKQAVAKDPDSVLSTTLLDQVGIRVGKKP